MHACLKPNARMHACRLRAYGFYAFTYQGVSGSVPMHTRVSPLRTRVGSYTSLHSFAQANISSILLRLSALYAEAKHAKTRLDAAEAAGTAPAGGTAEIDASAIAAINKGLSDALTDHLRSMPKGGKHETLMRDLKVCLKRARAASDQLLRNSHVTPLSLEDRRRRWAEEREKAAAARRDVLDKVVTNWDSVWHIDAWLDTLEVSAEGKKILVREKVVRLQALLRVDDDKLERWRVPLGDRLRIRRGLAELRETVARCTSDLLKDGLWWLLSTEEHNQRKVTVHVPREILFDQGSEGPNLRGLRVGDTALLDAADHGKSLPRSHDMTAPPTCARTRTAAHEGSHACPHACTHTRREDACQDTRARRAGGEGFQA